MSIYALAALLAVVALAGCGSTGEDGEVAAALIASTQVQSRAFEGHVSMKPSAASATTKDAGFEMPFSGAIDTSDKANPKMAIQMKSAGDVTSVVAPGDGKVYVTTGGRSYYLPIPSQKEAASTVDPNKIYAALGSAVSSFKPSPPLTNHAGQSVHTVSTTISRSKLCGPVLDAFGDALTDASGIGGRSLGVGASVGAGGSKMLKGFCKSMLESDPRLWFGIDAGKMTDVVLQAKIKMPMAGQMQLDVAYHEYNQGGTQSGFDAPSGATPLQPTEPPTGGLEGFN